MKNLGIVGAGGGGGIFLRFFRAEKGLDMSDLPPRMDPLRSNHLHPGVAQKE